MSVLVDTTIWSLVFRKRSDPTPHVLHLHELLERGEAAILGPIRQEVLSGVRGKTQFFRLRNRLRAFPDVPLLEDHYERAAEFYNLCRAHDVQGSNTDFLICAAADLHGMPIYTTDQDFQYFARHLPIRLFRW